LVAVDFSEKIKNNSTLRFPPNARLDTNENNPRMTLEELEQLLDGCKNGNRLSQKRLYQQFYGYGMSVSMRFGQNREEAQEICNDSFVKAFSKMGDCASVGAFKSWFRRILVNTGIDCYRKNKSQPFLDDLDAAVGLSAAQTSGLDNISIDEKLKMVAQLPPAYRMAFNLYAVEGFSTTEIADSLQIAEGTVRGNLAKARFRLQKMIQESEKINHII
jgi:RNA polymerase sigma factor (sigma-70 family)